MPSSRDTPPPAVALANSTNWWASRAWDTGKFVISRSCDSSGDTCTRSATPRRSGSVSAWAIPEALENRTTVGYDAPGCANPARRSVGQVEEAQLGVVDREGRLGVKRPVDAVRDAVGAGVSSRS